MSLNQPISAVLDTENGLQPSAVVAHATAQAGRSSCRVTEPSCPGSPVRRTPISCFIIPLVRTGSLFVPERHIPLFSFRTPCGCFQPGCFPLHVVDYVAFVFLSPVATELPGKSQWTSVEGSGKLDQCSTFLPCTLAEHAGATGDTSPVL